MNAPIQQRPKKQNSNCSDCDLGCRFRVTNMPVVGPKNADIMIVGEALTEVDDHNRDYFSDDSGSKLNYCLELAGLRRKSIQISTVLRCRTKNKKTKPNKKQVDACAPYTLYDILKNKPKVIVAMGRFACETLISDWTSKFYRPDGTNQNKKKKLYDFRGFPVKQTFFYAGVKKVHSHTCWVIPTYQPSQALHNNNLDPILAWDLNLALKYSQGDEVLFMPKTKVEIVDTLPKIQRLCRNLVRAETYVSDLETTGLDPHDDLIVCAAFSWKEGQAAVIPWLDQSEMNKPYNFSWNKSDQETIIRDLRTVFQKTKLIGQGIKFDLKFLRKLTGLVEIPVDFDTMIGSHVLNENVPNNLTFQAQQDLHWDKYDNAADHYKKDKLCNLAHAPQEMVLNYGGYDVDATGQLARLQKKSLRTQNLITCYKTEAGLIQPVADLEYTGVKADKSLLLAMSKKYRKRQKELLLYLQKKAVEFLSEEDATDFNPNSTKQLSKLLKAAGATLKKKTASGADAVGGVILGQLAVKKNTVGRIASKVIELRSTVKYIGTYLDGKEGGEGVIQFIKPILYEGRLTDRICADYNLTKTKTGRLTATRWITFPKTGGARTIIAPDKDCVIISVDYAKAELCVMCWLANDPVMVGELSRGVDLHSHMAVTVMLNRVPTDEEYLHHLPSIDPKFRSLAKQVIFGVSYGRQAPSIVEMYPEYFDPKENKWDRIKKVDKIIQMFWEKYATIYDYMQEEIQRSKRKGELRTPLTGRFRRFHDQRNWFKSKHSSGCQFKLDDIQKMERQAMNYTVQSTASDELSKATVRVYKAIQRSKIPGLRIMLSIHDQLMFNCHEDHIEEATTLIVKEMRTVLKKGNGRKYEVPLNVDPELMSRWGLGLDGKLQY